MRKRERNPRGHKEVLSLFCNCHSNSFLWLYDIPSWRVCMAERKFPHFMVLFSTWNETTTFYVVCSGENRFFYGTGDDRSRKMKAKTSSVKRKMLNIKLLWVEYMWERLFTLMVLQWLTGKLIPEEITFDDLSICTRTSHIRHRWNEPFHDKAAMMNVKA